MEVIKTGRWRVPHNDSVALCPRVQRREMRMSKFTDKITSISQSRSSQKSRSANLNDSGTLISRRSFVGKGFAAGAGAAAVGLLPNTVKAEDERDRGGISSGDRWGESRV